MKVSTRAFVALCAAAVAMGIGPGLAPAAHEPTLAEPYQNRYTESSDDPDSSDYVNEVHNPYSLETMETMDAAEPKPAASTHAAPRPAAPAPVAQPAPSPVTEDCCESCRPSCGEICDPCCGRPTWTFRADGLFMNRSHAGSRVLARELLSGDVLLDTTDLDFDWQPAYRLAFSRRLGCSDWDLEAVYFQIGDLRADAAVTSNHFFDFTAPNMLVLAAPGDFMDFRYQSRLYSTELNLKRRIGPVTTLLFGFRWVEMSEEFSAVRIDNIGTLHFWNTDVNNHLYGAQVGADVMLWDRGGPLTVRGTGKAGVYYNDASQSSRGALLHAGAKDHHTSFLGELEIVGVYRVNQHLALRAGYEMLWLSGVALAPDQIDVTNLLGGVAAVDARGDAFYHGFVGGLELTW